MVFLDCNVYITQRGVRRKEGKLAKKRRKRKRIGPAWLNRMRHLKENCIPVAWANNKREILNEWWLESVKLFLVLQTYFLLQVVIGQLTMLSWVDGKVLMNWYKQLTQKNAFVVALRYDTWKEKIFNFWKTTVNLFWHLKLTDILRWRLFFIPHFTTAKKNSSQFFHRSLNLLSFARFSLFI